MNIKHLEIVNKVYLFSNMLKDLQYDVTGMKKVEPEPESLKKDRRPEHQ